MESNVIYALFAGPLVGVVRYVGQTRTGVERRFANHLAQARRSNPAYVYNWMRNVGLDMVRYTVLEVVDDPQLLNERERYWIAYYRAEGHPLTNIGDGGGAAWSGQKRPAQAQRMTGEANPMWGQDRRDLMIRIRNIQGSPTAETRAKWSKNRRGEKNSRAKLTEADVREARRLFATGEYTKSALARQYNITVQSMWALLNGKTWAHVK